MAETPSWRSSDAVLLAEIEWIRRLARALVADRDLADDLVQETCAVALERRPEPPARLRPWLAAVLHNALRQHRRAAGRRRFREALRARAEASEETEAALARVRLQQHLVERVLELDEPYRSAVVLRYFEELPPREIARREGVPVATVHSRLQRALARLRQRLDREREDWAFVLLPAGALDLGPFFLLTAFMKTKAFLAASSTLLVAAALLWWTRAESVESASTPVVEPALAPTPLAASSPARENAPEDEEAEREPVLPGPRVAPTSSAQPITSPRRWTARVRVLDAEGEPLAGIALRGSDAERVLATSGGGGWCTFETEADRLSLAPVEPAWIPVREGVVARDGRTPGVVVVARALDLSGFVHDASGLALAGAQVRFALPDGFATRFSEDLEGTRAREWVTLSDREGRFAFAGVPTVRGASLRAVLAGFEGEESPAPDASRDDLELVLFRPHVPLAGVLEGKVLDEDGQPVPEARVGLGLASVLTDERGAFSLELSRAVTAEVLTAVKAGHRPARLTRPAEPEGDFSGWPDSVVLVLGGPALTLGGRVVDAEGEPVSGAKVWLHDPTPAAPVGRLLTQLETLSAGIAVPSEALEQAERLPASDGDYRWTQDDVAGAPSAQWYWVATDASGRFEIGGLAPRRYRLDVLAPGTLAVATSESFEAGTSSALVRLGPPEVFEEVRGRVVGATGQGVEGVQLFLMVAVVDVQGRVFGGTQRSLLYERGGFARSDADGRFGFSRVPRQRARILIRGDEVVPRTVDVTEAEPVIEVEQRCSLEIVLRPPTDRFDRFELADAAGQPLPVLFVTHGSSDARASAPLVEGRSGVVSGSSRAREVRFFRENQRVDTQPIFLIPGQVNRLEY